MVTQTVGDMLHEIGVQVARELGKVPEDVFVFIEAGDQWCGGAIFDNMGDRIIYHDLSHDTCETILRLWEAAPSDQKWSIIEYDISRGNFDAKFRFTSDLEHHPMEYDYRQDALEARYGNKPVDYPPMEDGNWQELTENDLLEDGSG